MMSRIPKTASCCLVLILAMPGWLDFSPSVVESLVALPGGTLVICGGGELVEDAIDAFVKAAGGHDAEIVVVTTASSRADTDEIEDELEFWRQRGVANLRVLHTRSRDMANDREFASSLATASGVWFVGGKQAWLADTYLGTVCETMIHDVLRRGGVVGGTSAGAAVMSEIMIRRGNPLPETGRGFGLLPGTVIDQHFLARNRQHRLLEALAAHPGLIGLGIDEGTALIVNGGRLSVVGRSSVIACLPPITGKAPNLQRLLPGTRVDLRGLTAASKSLSSALIEVAAD
jgi:cyanophycinase